ncbi:MAG: RagB/SusD family nutrient uptake outer membrane protein, partial [Bacteroidota bacterium]
GMASCEKYLDEKPDKKLVVPETLTDLQALLDFAPAVAGDAAADQVSSDDYYLTTADYQSLPGEPERRMYTWEKDHIFTGYPNDWSKLYNRIYYVNTVLEALTEINRTAANATTYDHVKGQAMLLRGKSFLQAAIIWSKAYDEATAATEPGIPLKVTPDFNELSVRATLKQTFAVLLTDLKTAAALLPVKPVHVIRPSRPAAFGYLARAYLYMRQYQLAGAYADSCLQLKNDLLDYNSLNPGANFFVKYNIEQVIYSVSSAPQLYNSVALVDSNIYQLYDTNDLRKTVFFKSNGNGAYFFKGSYDGNFGNVYTGIAVDEMLLVRAECFARSGNKQAALDDLNTLLIKRWKTGAFAPVTTATAAEAVQLILTERRKELLLRGLRFLDLKRLNKDGAAISLTRIVDGQSYTLPPNDKRYALPIPEDVINISGMEQNPR